MYQHVSKFGMQFLLAISLGAFIVGCTEGQKGDPIVIPPGQMIEYSNAQFVSVAKTYYTMELLRYDSKSGKFYSIGDLTPTENKDVEQSIRHIVPKAENKAGLYIVRASLAVQGMNLTAFVTPGLIAPSLASTMVVDLVTTYPGFDVSTITEDTVISLTDEIQKAIGRGTAEFEMKGDEFSYKTWYRFLQNYVARDTAVLKLAEDKGFEFDVDSEGLIKSEPFPFGKKNLQPSLDEGNSTPRSSLVMGRENTKLLMKGRATDPEADEILYRWYRGGVLQSKDPFTWEWTPGFQDYSEDPYKISLKISDGGIPRTVEWNVKILDYNRAPEIDYICDKEVAEDQTWTCKLTAQDFDGDATNFTINDKSASARVQVDGQQTDDVTRILKVMGKPEVTLKIKPNNIDAKKRNIYLDISVDDGKMGVKSVPINVGVKDINSPPEIVTVAGSAIQSMVPGTVAHEWDYCANEDPDGLGPYRFMIEVRDPDNQSSVFPRNQHPDEVSVTFGGSLKEALVVVTEAEGCPTSTPEKSTFCFEWKPKNSPKTGTLTLTLKDDHGGISQVPGPTVPLPITMTAEDRNVRPCLKSKGQSLTLSDNMSQFIDEMGGEDEDETSPWPELADVPMPVIPLLGTEDATQAMLVFRKTRFNPSEWVTRFPKASSGPSAASYSIWQKRPLSGIVTFTRTAAHSADITIAQGTVIKTNTISPKISFEVAQAVTMAKDDLSVTVPVRAVSRSVPVGKLNRFVTPVAGFSVTNASALTGSGQVTLSRSSAVSVVTIPPGTEFGTSELADGSETIHYQSIDNVVFNVGVSAMNIRVRRVLLKAAIGTVTDVGSSTWAGPSLSISNPVALSDIAQYTLMRDLQKGETLNVDRFCWNRRVADSGVVANGTSLKSNLGSLPMDVVFTASGDMGLYGEVKVTRSSSATALTINSGTRFHPLDRSYFSSVSGVTLAVGVSQAVIPVSRVQHLNPPPPSINDRQVCAGWTDTNYEPAFLNSTGLKVPEGGTVVDFEINVTDNRSDPTEPNDFLDRHTFTTALVGGAPQGAYRTCREPGTDVIDINANCTACDATTGTYFEASSCFFRFKPGLNDVSQIFSFNITVNDNGMNYPTGTNIRNQSLNVSVIENNDPPTHTDLSGVPLANTVINSNVYLGEYVEGNEDKYRLYLSDADKGTELKNLIAPTLVKTWQFISPAGWKERTAPSGIILELVAPSMMDPSGWGSKTTAQVRWRPNDNDVKRFAGTAGFVLEISACDQGNADSPRACRTGFYRFTTRNINNLPSVSASTSISTVAMQADLYQTKAFNIVDNDYATNSTMPDTNSSFLTKLSMCSAANVYDCAADQTGWPVVLSQADFPYAATATNINCQSGGALTANRVPQLQLTSAAGSISGTQRVYPYLLKWCPQKKHIGSHLVYFNIKDNGDEDFRGPSSLLAAQNVQIPVRLNVVAPVFFESPKRATSGNEAVFWMRQAFSLTEYRYELFINNSRGNKVNVTMPIRARLGASAVVGNPVLELRSYANPVTVSTNASTLSNVDLKTHRVFLVWTPYGATTNTHYISTADTATWPLFQLNVKDATNTENETVQFRVQVKDPLSPLNVAPTINSYFPAVTSISIPEQVAQTFSVSASDANGDPITYRWYLDGRLVSDSGNSYSYLPTMDDAFLPAVTPGKHQVMVQVVDGQERTTNSSYTWTVNVRNTVPLPTRMNYFNTTTPWTFAQSVIERGYTGGITNLVWGPTAPVATMVGVDSQNHLLFTGSYSRASVVRNFVWRLQFTNSLFNDNNASTLAQGTELLPWASGRKSEQISYLQDGANLKNILVSSNKDPESPFAGTADAVTLSPTLASIASLTASNACTGTCSYNFFQNMASQSSTTPQAGFVSSSGTQNSAAYLDGSITYYFFTTDEAVKLKWSRAGSAATLLSTMTGNDRIGDIAVNPATRRLYVTVRDVAAIRNFIYVYDLYNISSGNISLISTIPVSDGVTADNRILDLAVDRAKNRVYALLPGTGGVVSFVDNGSIAPVAADLQFIGVNQVSSSYTDAVGVGRKLVFNPNTQLLYGISKDANEVFIIDTKDNSFNVKVFRADVALDEIVTFSNDGLTLAINRTLGWIYLVR